MTYSNPTIARIEKYNRVIGCILWRNTREKFLKRRRNSRESRKMRSAKGGSDRQNDSRSIYTEIKHPFELPGSRMESRKAQINAIRSVVARECRREHRRKQLRDRSSVTAVGNCPFLLKLRFVISTGFKLFTSNSW